MRVGLLIGLDQQQVQVRTEVCELYKSDNILLHTTHAGNTRKRVYLSACVILMTHE